MIGYKYTTEELANEARQSVNEWIHTLPLIPYNPVVSQLPL